MPPLLFLRLPALFAAGFIAGLYGASVGSGSLVTMPALIFAGLPIHGVIATNRLAALGVEAGAAFHFIRKGMVQWKQIIPYIIVAGIGALIGARLLIEVPESILNIISAFLLLFVLVFLLSHKAIGIQQKEKPLFNKTVLLIFIFLISVFAGFFGAGCGTLFLIIFVLYGYSFLQSAAVSRVIGGVEAIAATAYFMTQGIVHYPEGIAIGTGSLIGGWIGAGVAIKKGNPYIRVLLVVIIILSTGKLLWKTFM